MLHIGIITYNYRHLKTEQVLEKLFRKDIKESRFTIFALQFFPRPARNELFSHRPNQFTGIETSNMAKLYNIPFIECASDIDIQYGYDLYIITGAGVISKTALLGKRIINCHPGIIPIVRGLDSFKWAIIEGKPIGNTLHFIDENVDGGDIIAVKQTPLYQDDTLSSFATRHYANEIDMLANYSHYLQNPHNDFVTAEQYNTYRRMPVMIEQKLESVFDKYKELFALPLSLGTTSNYSL